MPGASSWKAQALAVAACMSGAAAVSVSRGFLAHSSNMRPGVVARSLARVEDEWSSQAVAFTECNTTAEVDEDCSIAPKAFDKSCGTIVSAVMQASSGDRTVVGEYMGDVCGQEVLKGWRQARCESLSHLLVDMMSADTYENREHLDTTKICSTFWTNVVTEEKARIQKEQAEAAAAEEAHRKAEEAEEAAEETKVQEAKKKAEEAAAAEEAAVEAKEKAEKAASVAADAKAPSAGENETRPDGRGAGERDGGNATRGDGRGPGERGGDGSGPDAGAAASPQDPPPAEAEATLAAVDNATQSGGGNATDGAPNISQGSPPQGAEATSLAADVHPHDAVTQPSSNQTEVAIQPVGNQTSAGTGSTQGAQPQDAKAQ